MKLLSLLAVALLSAAAFAEEPIKTNPCELNANPTAFHHKLVTVRAAVLIAFEDSGFDADCSGEHPHSVWIGFGGNVRTPTTYCCGEHRPSGSNLTIDGIEMPLRQDAAFYEFYRLLTAQRETAPSGVPCFYDCYLFRPTATLTGHFFQAEVHSLPSGQKIPNGYGHLGCCSLFVIEQVADVSAAPTSIPQSDDYRCEHTPTKLPVKATADDPAADPEDPTYFQDGRVVVKEQMRHSGWDFQAGEETAGTLGTNQKAARAADYYWLSNDKLKSYTVHFERAKGRWVPVEIEQAVCVPK